MELHAPCSMEGEGEGDTVAVEQVGDEEEKTLKDAEDAEDSEDDLEGLGVMPPRLARRGHSSRASITIMQVGVEGEEGGREDLNPLDAGGGGDVQPAPAGPGTPGRQVALLLLMGASTTWCGLNKSYDIIIGSSLAVSYNVSNQSL